MIERESIPLMRIRHEFKEDHLDSSGGKLIRKDCFYAQQQLNWPVYTNGVEFTERNAPTWYHDPCNRYFLIVFLQEGEIRYSAGGEKLEMRLLSLPMPLKNPQNAIAEIYRAVYGIESKREA